MLPFSRSSNLTEALLNAKNVEKKLVRQGFAFIDQDRNKIRSTADRHMETFIQMTRKRHEVWYRNDKHFREALRKEKDRYEKRKERNYQKLLEVNNPTLLARNQTPFEPFASESVVLPEVVKKETIVGNKRPNPPISKIERRTFQVLRSSQKLLDDSAARTRSKYNGQRVGSATPTQSSSSLSFSSSSLMIPVPNAYDCEEYERLCNQSLECENFHHFVNHFVEFSPEYRENFARINEATKRQKAIEKMRQINRSHTLAKDSRYHNLIESLTVENSTKEKKSIKV